MPILTIGLGVGLEAQNVIAQKNGKMPILSDRAQTAV